MTIIQKDGYIFSVDTEKTIEYYITHSVCDCVYCKNFYAQVKQKFPKLDEFLSEFGVDISKPDEITGIETDNDIDYFNVDYTVYGSIQSMVKDEINIYDGFLSIVITNGYTSLNEQPYFTISVKQMKLHWVLDTPFPKPLTERCFTKIKKFFGKA